MAASMAAVRNSLEFEIDKSLKKEINSIKGWIKDFSNQVLQERLHNHMSFVKQRIELGKEIKHKNKYYGFPVITNQEKVLLLNNLMDVKQSDKGNFKVKYSDNPQDQYYSDRQD